jgi:predicted ferric reductase
MLKKTLFILLYFLSPIFLIYALYTGNPDKYDTFTSTYPMILGAIAYTWLIGEFVLVARPKFIEKYFGMDKLYRFHGLMAVVSIFMAYVHQENISGRYGEVRDYGDFAYNIFLAIIIISLLFMVDSIILKIKPILFIRKLVGRLKILKYMHYVAIHNLTILALIFMLIHVLLTTNAKENLSVRIIYILYFSIGAIFYLYHRVFKMLILRKNIYIVKEVIQESTNMWTFRLAPEKGKILPYKPGQFGFLRFLGKNISMEEHPFSISSEPSNTEYLSVTIKELGDYTSCVKNITAGYKAYIDAPYGNFCYIDYPNEEEIVLIAGGVGITPILSTLRHITKHDKGKNVVLFWGINNQNDLICKDEFLKMQSELKNFLFVPVAFNDDTWEGEKGIINGDKIKAVLENHGSNVLSKSYYICGPSIMLDGVIKGLKTLGIKRTKIHYEKFSL